MGQRTANKPDLYLIERQIVIKFCCSSPRKSGDHEQGCFALYCVSMDYKKLMFAVRIPVRGINPSTATKLRTPTFPGDLRFYIVILSGSPLSFRAKRGIWCRTPEPRTGMALQILHSAFAASMVTRRSRCRRVLYHIVLLNMVSVKVGLLPAMS